jgi:hypothetical protein
VNLLANRTLLRRPLAVGRFRGQFWGVTSCCIAAPEQKDRPVTEQSLEDVDNLPPQEEIAAEIVESLQEALDAFKEVAEELVESGATQGAMKQ